MITLYLYFEDRISCCIHLNNKTMCGISVCSLDDAVKELIDSLPSWLKDGLDHYELIFNGDLKNYETKDLFN